MTNTDLGSTTHKIKDFTAEQICYVDHNPQLQLCSIRVLRQGIAFSDTSQNQ